MFEVLTINTMWFELAIRAFAPLLLVFIINVLFKDAQSRRHFRNTLQTSVYDSAFIAKYDSALNNHFLSK